MNPKCPKCGSQIVTKNGFKATEQRWLCKDCRYNFTKLEMPQKGKPVIMKSFAVLLYVSKMSIRGIAKLFTVSPTTILNWIREFAKNINIEEESERIRVLEIDEMWHFCEKKIKKSGYGKRLIVMEADLLTGKLEIGMLIPLKNSGNV